MQISDTSGKKDVEIDLSREVAIASDNGDSISIRVEVTDETRRTYESMATVRVEKQPVKLEFDRARTDLVYHPRMPYRAVVGCILQSFTLWCCSTMMLQPTNVHTLLLWPAKVDFPDCEVSQFNVVAYRVLRYNVSVCRVLRCNIVALQDLTM